MKVIIFLHVTCCTIVLTVFANESKDAATKDYGGVPDEYNINKFSEKVYAKKDSTIAEFTVMVQEEYNRFQESARIVATTDEGSQKCYDKMDEVFGEIFEHFQKQSAKHKEEAIKAFEKTLYEAKKVNCEKYYKFNKFVNLLKLISF